MFSYLTELDVVLVDVALSGAAAKLGASAVHALFEGDAGEDAPTHEADAQLPFVVRVPIL